MSSSVKIKPAARFGLRLLLLLLPFLAIVVVYFIFDPFMVLHRYKRFDRSHVMLNEAYVGWQNYMTNRDSIGYSSFIVGNSCTMAFRTDDWEKYLPKGDRAVRFFDTGETLGGVSQKLEALDAAGAPIKNVLVVVSKGLLKEAYPMEDNGHLFSAEVAKMSQIEFQMCFLQKFLNPNFTIPYLDYMVTGEYSSYMNGIINPGAPIREPYTNNFINPREKDIKSEGDRFWTTNKKDFPPRVDAGKEDERVIFSKQLKLLQDIKHVCDRHGASLVFVVGPEYNQKRLNGRDVMLLKSVFGDTAVWDFTGINRFTSDVYNYYDQNHYRPVLGRLLLEHIYGKQIK